MSIDRERIEIIREHPSEDIEVACDLCDGSEFPMLSWACYWDDDYIRTIICSECAKELRKII